MKKIMFNDKYSLTQAVLDGKKTMTRRIANPATDKQISFGNVNKEWYEDEEGKVYIPSYEIGEVIAISQNYKDAGYDGHSIFGDSFSIKSLPGWSNKMFVKAEYMPHHIKITAIRLEPLQDILEEDCLKEGVMFDDTIECYYHLEKGRQNGLSITAKSCFSELIDKVSSSGIWKSNPFVWVYEFELID